VDEDQQVILVGWHLEQHMATKKTSNENFPIQCWHRNNAIHIILSLWLYKLYNCTTVFNLHCLGLQTFNTTMTLHEFLLLNSFFLKCCVCCRCTNIEPSNVGMTFYGSLQEAQLMLTTGSTSLAVSLGQQTWYHSTCYI